MTTTEICELDTATAVLDYAREQRRIADRAEANLLEAAVAWAAMHSVDSIEEAETLIEAAFGDSGMPLAGAGAPLVAEFAVTEFAAAIGLSTDAGKRYVGHALELRYRLPRVWARVQAGDLRPWLARRIAEKTLLRCHRRQRRSWTGTSPERRTGSDRSSWTGSWMRRSARSCRIWPKRGAWRRRTAATSRSSPSSEPPTTAPSPCTVSWTWPTPCTSRTRSRPSPPS